MKLSFESLKITAVGKRLRLTTPHPHQGFTEMGLDIINQKKKKKNPNTLLYIQFPQKNS